VVTHSSMLCIWYLVIEKSIPTLIALAMILIGVFKCRIAKK